MRILLSILIILCSVDAYALDLNNFGAFTESWQRNKPNKGILLNMPLINSVGGKIQGSATFARASVQNGTNDDLTISQVATNIPFFNSEGILLESSATNICLQSQTLDNASWIKQNLTITANSAVAPDGTQTADTLTASTSGSNRENGLPLVLTAGNTYAVSFYIKPGTASWSYVILTDRTAHSNGRYFDTTNGVIGTSTGLSVGSNVSYVSSSILPVANGFYRCVVILTINATTTYYATVGVVDNNSSASVTAGKTLYAWQAQLESGTTATSPIITTTTSVTRAMTGLSLPSANNIVANDGVIYAEYTHLGTSGYTYSPVWSETAVASNTNMFQLAYNHVNSSFEANKYLNSVSNITSLTMAITPNTLYKIAVRYSSTSGTDIFANGVKGINNANTADLALQGAFYIGGEWNGTHDPRNNKYIRNVKTFNRSLSDSELIRMTSP